MYENTHLPTVLEHTLLNLTTLLDEARYPIVCFSIPRLVRDDLYFFKIVFQ